MPSARTVLIATVASSASAQYTTSVAVSGYDSTMPTLSSYGSPQDWQQWNTYNGGWSSSASAVSSYATPVTPGYSSDLYTYPSESVTTTSAYYGSSLASSSSVPYENPFTIYLSQTNSMGVVTGMPSVVTSQPTVVTSQPAVATTPAGYVPTTSAATNTTLLTSARPKTSATTSESGSFNQNPSGTTSARIGSSTGAGVKDSVTGAGLALVVAGMVFSLL